MSKKKGALVRPQEGSRVHHRSNPNSVGTVTRIGSEGDWMRVEWDEGANYKERRSIINYWSELAVVDG